MPTLYDPIQLGGRTARNRLVMAPMLTTHRPLEGAPLPWHVDYYGARAADGVGVLVVECTAVDRDNRNSPGEIGLWEDAQVETMRPIADAIRAGGALGLPQIHHAGRNTPASISQTPFSPSEDVLGDGRITHAMTDGEVVRSVGQFADAARRAAEAGFDGVELHGCHGYLIDQFVSPVANRRDDRWGGGTVDARLAYSRAVIAAVRAATPDGFILGYRMGFNDPDAAAGEAIARGLAACGVDYLSVSGGIGPGPMPDAEGDAHGYWVAARRVREATGVPTFAVNTIHTLTKAERVVAQGFGDAAAVGRPYLFNPDWMTAQREGRPLVECLLCKGGCHYLRGKCPRMKMP